MESNEVIDLRRTVTLTSAVNKAIHDTHIVSFGIIKKVIAKGVVLVELSVARKANAIKLITCPLLMPTCQNITIDIEPKENDKVLVLFLKDFDPDMFDLKRDETIITESASGYNLLSGVAILFSQYKTQSHKNVLHIGIDDNNKIKIEDNHGCTIESSDESIIINGKLEIKK